MHASRVPTPLILRGFFREISLFLPSQRHWRILLANCRVGFCNISPFRHHFLCYISPFQHHYLCYISPFQHHYLCYISPFQHHYLCYISPFQHHYLFLFQPFSSIFCVSFLLDVSVIFNPFSTIVAFM